MEIKKIKSRRVIAFVIMLTWIAFMLPSYALGAISSSNEITTEQLVEELALNFAEPDDDAELISIQPISDDYLEQELWSVRWITPEHKIIEVKFDATSHEIVYFLDTDRKHEQNTDLFLMSDRAVLEIATNFLNKLEVFGCNPLPEDANPMEISEDEYGWQISWEHVVDTIPVLGDFVRIRVSRDSGLVYSYSKCWHSVGITPVPLLMCSDAEDAVHREDPRSINMTIQSELNVVGRFLDGRVSYEPQLAWVTTAKSQNGGTIVYYIDARTGELAFRDSTLDIYADVFVLDPDGNGEATYECATEVYNRLDLATDWYARYYEDQTYIQEVTKFQYERVLYHIGHGFYGEYDSEVQTYLNTDTDNIWASDVNDLDLSGMDLAFLSGCWTAANNYPVYFLW